MSYLWGVKRNLALGDEAYLDGPERQFAAWEEYLRSVEGPVTKVYRLYPRDFWQHE